MVSALYRHILAENDGIDLAMGIAAHTGLFPDSGIDLHASLLLLSHIAWVTGIEDVSLGMTDFAELELLVDRARRLLERGFL